MICLFFFSSRRRHTRSLCDWSSDVCSSDLELGLPAKVRQASMGAEERFLGGLFRFGRAAEHAQGDPEDAVLMGDHELLRSEERRVGKECRARWWADH